jgi:hypothetical protein
MTHPTMDPFVVKGTSTYYDKDGAPRAQWVKTRLDDQAYLEAVKEAVAGFLDGVDPVPGLHPCPAATPT